MVSIIFNIIPGPYQRHPVNVPRNVVNPRTNEQTIPATGLLLAAPPFAVVYSDPEMDWLMEWYVIDGFWVYHIVTHNVVSSSTLLRNPMKNPFNQRICIKLFQ